jgi:hypothetical protein
VQPLNLEPDISDQLSINSIHSHDTYSRTETALPANQRGPDYLPTQRAPDHYQPFDSFEDATYQAMCLAVRLQTTLQLQKAKRLTRRRLMQQADWPEWCKAEFKMLDQYAAVNMYGHPVLRSTLPTETPILKSLWCYVLKADGRRKAAMSAMDNPTANVPVRNPSP